MKLIRWSGLITFSAITATLIGGSLLFAESIIESLFESSLTDMNQAKVDIDSVELSYSPLSLTINDIQVSDGTNPMINSVQIGQANFTLSSGDLLLKKVIIDDMSLSNIRIDTPRKYSGALRQEKQIVPSVSDESQKFEIEMPDIDLPSIDDVLQSNPLQSIQTINQLSQDLDSTKNQWTQISDDIKDPKRWNDHEAKYTKIRNDFKGNFVQKLNSIKEAKTLSNEYKKEVDRIRNARNQINTDSQRLETAYKAAKAAPKNDIDRIKQKYKLDDLSTGNITELLFGQQARDYLALAQTWYNRIKPYIPEDSEDSIEEAEIIRAKGEFISFREFNPKPDFFVRKVAIDAQIPRGKFAGTINDISSNQSISGKPIRFLLTGQELRHRDSEQLSGEFNYVVKGKGYSSVNYHIKRYQLKDISISSSKKLSLNMARSLMNFDLSTRIHSGQLTGQADITFNDVQFKSNTGSSGTLPRMFAASFADVRDFNIDARMKGNFKDMDMRLKSNLDNQIGAQFKNQVNDKKEKFETELRARIDAKIRQPMAKIEAQKRKLDALKQQIDTKEKEIKQKLANLNNKITQEKKIKKQLLDRFKL